MRADNIPEEQIQQAVAAVAAEHPAKHGAGAQGAFRLQKIAEVEKIEVNDRTLTPDRAHGEQSEESPRRHPRSPGTRRPARRRGSRDDRAEGAQPDPRERHLRGDTPVGEDLQEALTAVEQQAVPGEMRDIEAEARRSASR